MLPVFYAQYTGFVNAVWDFTHWSFIQKEARSWQSLVTYIVQGWFCIDSELSPLLCLFFSDLFQCQYQTFSSLVFLIKLGGQSLEKNKLVDFFIKSISNLLEVIPLYTPVKTDKTLGVVVKVYELPVSFMLEKKYW